MVSFWFCQQVIQCVHVQYLSNICLHHGDQLNKIAQEKSCLNVGCSCFSQIKDGIRESIKDKMNQQYGENADVTKSIDKLQTEVGVRLLLVQ